MSKPTGSDVCLKGKIAQGESKWGGGKGGWMLRSRGQGWLFQGRDTCIDRAGRGRGPGVWGTEGTNLPDSLHPFLLDPLT